MANSSKNVQRALGMGAGLALAGAAATAAYFLHGKQGLKTRKMVRSWMLKARGEILEEIENLKDFNKKTYHNILQTVAEKYKTLPHVDAKELAQMMRELKSHWGEIEKHLSRTVKTNQHTTKRKS